MSTSLTPADLTSTGVWRGRPLSGIDKFLRGLRGRLLLAFFAISLFVIAAAAAGLYALREVGRTVDGLTL
jgi:hypothetical protein